MSNEVVYADAIHILAQALKLQVGRFALKKPTIITVLRLQVKTYCFFFLSSGRRIRVRHHWHTGRRTQHGHAAGRSQVHRDA